LYFGTSAVLTFGMCLTQIDRVDFHTPKQPASVQDPIQPQHSRNTLLGPILLVDNGQKGLGKHTTAKGSSNVPKAKVGQDGPHGNNGQGSIHVLNKESRINGIQHLRCQTRRILNVSICIDNALHDRHSTGAKVFWEDIPIEKVRDGFDKDRKHYICFCNKG